jgi:serine protease Do
MRIAACTVALALSTVAPAADAPPAGSAPGVQVAIDAVYPALVQIYVLALEHDGGRERKMQAAGSGAIITPEGHVVTNHHVAGEVADIRCILSTREELRATLVGTDPLSDIAVIKLDLSGRPAGAKLPVAHFASSSQLKVGDPVLAMGCPLAISQSVTRGIVSNTDMTMPQGFGPQLELQGENVGSAVKWIGHDAQIFPGNSGGPLVDLAGGIVGVNEISYGLGGAIPSDLAKAVAEQLIANGKVKRAWVGAAFQPLLKDEVAQGRDRGVLIAGVVPGGPAERAGLKAGDIVTAVDGAEVRVRFVEELPGFQNLILGHAIDKPIELAVENAGAKRTVTITAVPRDDARGTETESKEWGLTVRRLTVMEAKNLHRADTKGVLIGSVRPGGPANSAVPDLRAEDVIVEIGGKPVDDMQAFDAATAALLKDAKDPVAALVRFEREGEQQLTVVEVGMRASAEPPAPARHAWLPVATQVLSPKLAAALGLKGKKGVRVTELYPGAAEQTGLQVGDIITHLDDQLIEASAPQDAQLFESMVRAYKPDAKVELTVIRGGETKKLTVAFGQAPRQDGEMKLYDDTALEFKARDIAYADRVKRRWPADKSGALVREVAAGGWAAVGGLHPDDLVLAVDGQAVDSAAGLEARLKPIEARHATHITLFVERGIQTAFVELQPAWPAKP